MEAELLNTVKDRYEYRGCGLWVKHQFNSGVVIGQRAGTVLRDGYRQINRQEELKAQRDELLAALKGMLEVFGDEFGMCDSSVCDDARAAIKKAEGGAI